MGWGVGLGLGVSDVNKPSVALFLFVRAKLPPMEGRTVAGIGVGYAQQLDTETE